MNIKRPGTNPGSKRKLSKQENYNWETIYNYDNYEKWVRCANGTDRKVIHTYGGAPAGGYYIYRNGRVTAWRQDWYTLVQEHDLGDVRLEIRKQPDTVDQVCVIFNVSGASY
jgi:hypothetical protein